MLLLLETQVIVDQGLLSVENWMALFNLSGCNKVNPRLIYLEDIAKLFRNDYVSINKEH